MRVYKFYRDLGIFIVVVLGVFAAFIQGVKYERNLFNVAVSKALSDEQYPPLADPVKGLISQCIRTGIMKTNEDKES